MKTSKFVTAKYLAAKSAKEIDGKTLIIDAVFTSDIQDEEKLCVRFKNVDKPLALNQTNLAILNEAYTDESDNWVNKSVVLNIVTVMFNGQPTQGIQLKVPN